MPTSVVAMPTDDAEVLRATGVTVVRAGRTIVDGLDLCVREGERWVVLGPNGCGKTTLLRVLALYLHPSRGTVAVGARELGTFDVRTVRPRIAYVSASLATDLRPALTAMEAVMTARHGALEPWWHEYGDDDRKRALVCLGRMGVAGFAERPLGSLSSGEQQRVLLARALMTDPVAVLLDEPSARLDLGGREQLVAILDSFAAANPRLPTVIVTHHVDEIPPSTTHAMLMRDGRAVAAGPVDRVIDAANLGGCFGMDLVVERRANGRLTAWAR